MSRETGQQRLAAHRDAASLKAWRAIEALVKSGAEAPSEPRVLLDAADALGEYRAHLDATAVTGRHHPDLAQLVDTLERTPSDTPVRIDYSPGGENIAVLVSKAAGSPLGLVALSRQA